MKFSLFLLFLSFQSVWFSFVLCSETLLCRRAPVAGGVRSIVEQLKQRIERDIHKETAAPAEPSAGAESETILQIIESWHRQNKTTKTKTKTKPKTHHIVPFTRNTAKRSRPNILIENCTICIMVKYFCKSGVLVFLNSVRISKLDNKLFAHV